MQKNITSPLYNKRVYSADKLKTIGRIRAFVFIEIDNSKNEKFDELVGYVIKRPDLLWMFHRAPAYVYVDDLVKDKKGYLTVPTKKHFYKKNQIIPNTNIKWKDADVSYIDSIAPETAKKLLQLATEKITKDAVPIAKSTINKAGKTASENLQTHSDSLHSMFKEFKESYNEGRYED